MLHATEPTFQEVENRQALDLNDYQTVGLIWATDLEDLFRKTNHIDAAWHEKARNDIQYLRPRENGRPPRSTSVGDLAIDSDGVIWCCAICGWKRLE